MIGAANSSSRRMILVVVLIDLGVFGTVLWQAYSGRLNRDSIPWVVWISILVLHLALCLRPSFRMALGGRRGCLRIALYALLTGIVTNAVAAHIAQPGSTLELARSGISVDKIRDPRSRLVVELLRNDIKATERNTQDVKNARPIEPPLYSPASFQNVAVMQKVQIQASEAVSMDLHYESQLTANEAEFKKKMLVVDADYLREWEEKRASVVAMRQEILKKEVAWCDSVKNLYEYAEEHSPEILIQNGAIAAQSSDVRDLLNQKLAASRKALDEMQAAQKASAQIEHR